MPKKHYSTGTKSRREAIRARRRAAQVRNWTAIGAVLVIALIAIVAFAFNQSGNTTASPTTQGAQEISVQEAYEKYQQGVFLLDVREPEEWDNFHIPDTTLIPLGELPDRLSELPRDQEIVVVCNSGNRSQIGRDTLLEAGFTNVTSMKGGVTEWSNQGYPIEGTRP
jgi:rhodanese-related sulfurtransferase